MITVDTTGVLLRVAVLSAAVQDGAGRLARCALTPPVAPRVTAGWVDRGVTAAVTAVRDRVGGDLTVVQKLPDQQGCQVQPRRWVVERTFAWLTDGRRLTTEYDVYAETSEAFIYLAMIQLLPRRLAPAAAQRPWKTAHAA